ncbi:MAG TPA: 4-hydroxythreonine-4-phosphate dehydrogenase PdxA [Limnochordia bacterium]
MGQAAPIVGVTMGDPAGIGPEVILKAAAEAGAATGVRLLVIGHFGTMVRTCDRLGLPLALRRVDRPAAARFAPGTVDVLEATELDLDRLAIGRVQALAGRAAADCIDAAVALALAGEIDAVCTAPVHKEALRAAGVPHPGHTELLAALTGASEVAMLLVGERLRVAHATTHLALREACERLSAGRIATVIRLAAEVLRALGIDRPRIAVAGLNPHAGENGLFGDEEQAVIAPAVRAARAAGYHAEGPFPPDTIFHRAYAGEFDLVVAMYHDQGHIPIKLVHFSDAVNVTAGLPIVRTSVDHGTAFDIAGRGIADPRNMIAALRLAARLANGRTRAGAPSRPADGAE